MSTVTLEESFELEAAPEVVWSYLIDPGKIVVCLPGAELLSVRDERTFEGRVRVKVGAVTVNYGGTMEFTTIDTDARHVEMLGKGREKGGAGTATMKMEGRVEALDPVGSRIHITADVQLTGKIVRFGRGMIGAVSREVFSQFAECLGGLVNADAGESGADEAPVGDGDPQGDAPGDALGGTAFGDASPGAPPISAFGLLFRTLRSSLRRLLDRVFSKT